VLIVALIVVSHYGMFVLQVSQIYKDPSVGNPVSVAVVKVEILKVRRLTAGSVPSGFQRVVLNYSKSFEHLFTTIFTS
jgi:hypothetical protein